MIISEVLEKNFHLPHKANAVPYLRDRIEPYLKGGESRIESLRRVGSEDHSKQFLENRINQLHSWHRFFRKVLPVFKALAGKI